MAVCVCCNFIAVIDYNLLQEVKKLIFYRRNDILYTYCIHKHFICALRLIKRYDFRPVSRSIIIMWTETVPVMHGTMQLAQYNGCAIPVHVCGVERTELCCNLSSLKNVGLDLYEIEEYYTVYNPTCVSRKLFILVDLHCTLYNILSIH